MKWFYWHTCAIHTRLIADNNILWSIWLISSEFNTILAIVSSISAKSPISASLTLHKASHCLVFSSIGVQITFWPLSPCQVNISFFITSIKPISRPLFSEK